eukprot:gnl/Dysnectes_brevis/7961_a13823_202.p1 GENE.gnl/Dysnectes_brevis/7961_a13823_202~~gnl/Dysnectes_brevis/7961_a13823_202.p1  ORF type:complete len:558 (+),score=89.26 gnl/Dysnectes_brevis/7961_a13823_202:133-1806(+)
MSGEFSTYKDTKRLSPRDLDDSKHTLPSRPSSTASSRPSSTAGQPKMSAKARRQLQEATQQLEEARKLPISTDIIQVLLHVQRVFTRVYGSASIKTWEVARELIEISNNLALKYLTSGKKSKARELLRLAERECQPRPLQPSSEPERLLLVSTTLNSLACLYRKDGDHPRALRSTQRALAVDRSLSRGGNSPATHLNMCALHSEKGAHQRALMHALDAVLGARELLEDEEDGISAPSIPGYHSPGALLAVAYHNLAVQRQYTGDEGGASRAYHRAAKLARKHLTKQPKLMSLLMHPRTSGRPASVATPHRVVSALRGTPRGLRPRPRSRSGLSTRSVKSTTRPRSRGSSSRGSRRPPKSSSRPYSALGGDPLTTNPFLTQYEPLSFSRTRELEEIQVQLQSDPIRSAFTVVPRSPAAKQKPTGAVSSSSVAETSHECRSPPDATDDSLLRAAMKGGLVATEPVPIAGSTPPPPPHSSGATGRNSRQRPRSTSIQRDRPRSRTAGRGFGSGMDVKSTCSLFADTDDPPSLHESEDISVSSVQAIGSLPLLPDSAESFR